VGGRVEGVDWESIYDRRILCLLCLHSLTTHPHAPPNPKIPPHHLPAARLPPRMDRPPRAKPRLRLHQSRRIEARGQGRDRLTSPLVSPKGESAGRRAHQFFVAPRQLARKMPDLYEEMKKYYTLDPREYFTPRPDQSAGPAKPG